MGRSTVAITNIATSTMTAPRINAHVCHVFTADHYRGAANQSTPSTGIVSAKQAATPLNRGDLLNRAESVVPRRAVRPG
jgi:hypothetical protein